MDPAAGLNTDDNAASFVNWQLKTPACLLIASALLPFVLSEVIAPTLNQYSSIGLVPVTVKLVVVEVPIISMYLLPNL